MVKQSLLKKQNINLIRKSIELSDIKRELEDKNYELEITRSELQKQNIDLVRKSIELSDTMRQLEDKNYDLQLSQSNVKKTLSALRESEVRYRSLFDNVPVGLYLTSPSGQIIDANDAFVKMLEYPDCESLLVLNVNELYVKAEDYQRRQFLLERDGIIHNFEIQLYRLDGTVIWARDSTRVSRNTSGKILYYEGSMEDITNRKKSEEELIRYHDHLEELVRERTVKLDKTNEQLLAEIKDRKRAEEQITTSLREKEVLLTEIHHRVKNNLQIISSLLFLQSKRIKDEHALELYRDSQSRIQSMALIHEKLYQSEDFANINIAGYIRNLTSQLLRTYRTSGQHINLNINIQNISLTINSAIPCGLIINELVSNSLKHAFKNGNSGEICIDLFVDQCAGNAEEENHKYTLKVGDNGVGLPEDVDYMKTSSLGLQLVNNLTKQLGGTIKLDRSKGTEFKITFG